MSSDSKGYKRNSERKSNRNKKKRKIYNCYDYCVNSPDSPKENIIVEKENTIQPIEKKHSENIIYPENREEPFEPYSNIREKKYSEDKKQDKRTDAIDTYPKILEKKIQKIIHNTY